MTNEPFRSAHGCANTSVMGTEQGAAILALNAGSSSLKFALFEPRAGSRERTLSGLVERLGSDAPAATVRNANGEQKTTLRARPSPAELVAWVSQIVPLEELAAVGHRLVHGGRRWKEPLRVTRELAAELSALVPLDPVHLPLELALLTAFGEHASRRPQFACFDTAFHREMPRAARILPLPRRFQAQGIERYGFHGLAYASVLREIERRSGELPRRCVLAHLGSGSSLAAVADGRSIDTTMAFTPTSGIPTGTRTGDLDAGLAAYLLRSEKLDAAAFERLVTHEAGLLGISETSADVRDLLARRAHDERADDAISVYAYQTKKAIGALTAALGGLDCLAFSGGIGEHAASVRAEICAGLETCGIALDPAANAENRAVISSADARVRVHVVAADEEAMIAEATSKLLEEPA